MAKRGSKNKASEVVLVPDNLPPELVIMPINDRPVFPGMVIPLLLDNSERKKSLNYIMEKKGGVVGVVFMKEVEMSGAGFTEDPVPELSDGEISIEIGSHAEMGYDNEYISEHLHQVGCVAKIVRVSTTSDNNHLQVLLNVQKRMIINKILSKEPNLIASVQYIETPYNSDDPHLRAYVAALISKIKDLIKLNSIFSEEMKLFIGRYGTQEPGHLADMVTSMLTSINIQDMQGVLETFDLVERIPKVLHYVHKEVEVSKVKERINRQIENKISDQQRKYFLQEQLKEIKKELGLEKDEKQSEYEKFTKKFAELELTKEAKMVVEEELEKLQLYDVRSSEYGVSRNYLQWISCLPWGITTKDNLNINKVKKILNEDHYGLDEVKDRILEFVAIQKLKKKLSGSIILFVGPPGVGKTSFGRSIARALNREFYNFSLGGMRDEAEIKGHRRTYIGAMPGKIVQALKSVQTSNPVILMDEIDKVGSSYQGDPSSALLEVLDPEQNTRFQDHYLDLRFDLSKIIFICTANTIDTIPSALIDRMEIIRLSGYILEEKIEIAKRFVIPKQLDKHGMDETAVHFKHNTIENIAKYYARESGVRTLEQQITKVLRKVALKKAKRDTGKTYTIEPSDLKEYLGMERFPQELPYAQLVPGVVTGLAWTALGGSSLYIESISVGKNGKEGRLAITGQLGKVMIESANIAYAYVRSILKGDEKASSFLNETHIHLHVPEGATPKDGPSAGITMALSIYSLTMDKSVKKDLAMTGELTVTGRVLPIGGLREKLIAAKRVGMKKVLFPSENRSDYDELPSFVKKGIRVVFVDEFSDVLKSAF